MKRLASLIAVLALAAFGAAAQDFPGFSSSTPLGPRDVLDIRVLEDPTVSGRYTVGDDGRIIVNVVGRIDVGNQSAPEVEGLLKKMLEANYIRKATVSVQVVEFGSKPISVIGAVQKPGPVGGSTNMTLIQAITQAGGLTSMHGNELYVLRTGRNGLSEQLTVDVNDLIVNGNPDANIPLAPSDLINIPVDTPISIYVLGEVTKPGKVEFRRSQNPTLLQVISAAGGQTDRAAKKAIIKRVENGRETTTSINYRDIIKGKRQDVVLRDNDTVVLPESFF